MIIASFVQLSESELQDYEPTVVFVDEQNRITKIGTETPGPLTPTEC